MGEENTIRVLSGEEEYENVRSDRNIARDEYERNGSIAALRLVKRLDKILELYERSRNVKESQNDRFE